MSAEILRRAAADIRRDQGDEFMAAVADWLDSLAAEVEARVFYTEHPDLPPNTFHALTVARAYLGESA